MKKKRSEQERVHQSWQGKWLDCQICNRSCATRAATIENQPGTPRSSCQGKQCWQWRAERHVSEQGPERPRHVRTKCNSRDRCQYESRCALLSHVHPKRHGTCQSSSDWPLNPKFGSGLVLALCLAHLKLQVRELLLARILLDASMCLLHIWQLFPRISLHLSRRLSCMSCCTGPRFAFCYPTMRHHHSQI